jgi:large subunit ribosomal protein L15
MSPVNLDRIQSWIDQGRLDPSKPITMKELHKSRCIHGVKRHGVKLLARVCLSHTCNAPHCPANAHGRTPSSSLRPSTLSSRAPPPKPSRVSSPSAAPSPRASTRPPPSSVSCVATPIRPYRSKPPPTSSASPPRRSPVSSPRPSSPPFSLPQPPRPPRRRPWLPS